MKRFAMTMVLCLSLMAVKAQVTREKIYDETINPLEQIDKAIVEASSQKKNIICQMGGNWCRWCLMFADFIKKDSDISKMVDDNFVYIHVNYTRKNANAELDNRLHGASRFGFPALVVLDAKGNVLHIQDSSFLEEGEGYNKEKVLRFMRNWTPAAVKGE